MALIIYELSAISKQAKFEFKAENNEELELAKEIFERYLLERFHCDHINFEIALNLAFNLKHKTGLIYEERPLEYIQGWQHINITLITYRKLDSWYFFDKTL